MFNHFKGPLGDIRYLTIGGYLFLKASTTPNRFRIVASEDKPVLLIFTNHGANTPMLRAIQDSGADTTNALPANVGVAEPTTFEITSLDVTGGIQNSVIVEVLGDLS